MPEKPIPVVAAFIKDSQGRVLLTRRPPGKARGGLWEFPGGKVRDGEAPEEALARELYEELGVSARITRWLAEVVHSYPEITIRLILYEARLEDRPKPLEGQEMAWFPKKEIPNLPLCPADRRLLKVLQTRKGGLY